MNELTLHSNQAFSLTDASLNVYCGYDLAVLENKSLVYNATTSPDERLKDHINKKIKVANVICDIVEIDSNKQKREQGQVELPEKFEKFPRIILIDDKGKSYTCVSKGVFNSIKRMFDIYGEPTTWEKPMQVEILQKTISANRNVLLIKVV